MKKVPCETAVWETLPFIRCSLTICMVKEHCLSQKEAAEKVGVSAGAVSQYICGKRGKEMRVSKSIQSQVHQSSINIMEGDNAVVEILLNVII